ncbi:MAG: hypothetical protein KDK70_30795, partial [Myxococcales bacterium]|nr:hypothetical protein [Myxococcales bacterium]
PEPSRRAVPRPTPSRSSRPLAHVPNPVVERLRARAGLGDAAGRPRSTRIRATEPIMMRPPLRTRPEEEVTMRFRRPRGADAAAC